MEEESINKETTQPNNVVHGVKLKEMLVFLVKELGWEEMGNRIKINCFISNPSMGSSITFLRRTSWAKEQVQELYIDVKKNGKESTLFTDKLAASQKKLVGRKPGVVKVKPKEKDSKIQKPNKSENKKSLEDFINKHR